MARRYYQDRGREDITFCFSILVASPNTAHNQTCSQDTERLRHQRGKYTTVKNGMGKGFYELLKYISFYWHIIPPHQRSYFLLDSKRVKLWISHDKSPETKPALPRNAHSSSSLFWTQRKDNEPCKPFFFFFNCFGPLNRLKEVRYASSFTVGI